MTKLHGLERTAEERDPLAVMKSIWNHLINSCQKSPNAGAYIHIDTRMLAFCGRYSFQLNNKIVNNS